MENIIDATDAYAECLIHVLALRDLETAEHTRRVTDLTLSLAHILNIPDTELIHYRHGAMLHDVGKVGIPDSIFHKIAPLTRYEWGRIRMHPVYAYKLLSIVPNFRSALDIPYCHHEKWDGTGYPRQLKGNQIPLSARVFAIVDVWDALLSNRPYRSAWSVDRTVDYIEFQAGKQFDPEIAGVFIENAVVMPSGLNAMGKIPQGSCENLPIG